MVQHVSHLCQIQLSDFDRDPLGQLGGEVDDLPQLLGVARGRVEHLRRGGGEAAEALLEERLLREERVQLLVDVVLLLGERGERRRDLVGGAQRGHVEGLPLRLGRRGLRHGDAGSMVVALKTAP